MLIFSSNEVSSYTGWGMIYHLWTFEINPDRHSFIQALSMNRIFVSHGILLS